LQVTGLSHLHFCCFSAILNSTLPVIKISHRLLKITLETGDR
jgi:hypothetical protein